VQAAQYLAVSGRQTWYVGYSLKSKQFFDLPQYSMKIVTILGDNITVEQ